MPCIVTIVRIPVGIYELKTERQVRDYSNSLIDSEKNMKLLTSWSKKRYNWPTDTLLITGRISHFTMVLDCDAV
jgi:hypothetical protein